MGLYIYGITQLDGKDWNAPEGIREITVEGLTALVRPVEEEAPPLAESVALAHERVLESAMALGTVLPCSFGTIATNEEQVQGLLHRAREPLWDAINHLRGKEECGLKAYWLQDAVVREVEKEVGSLEKLKARGAVDRDVAIAVGQMVEAHLEKWKNTLGPAILAELTSYCLEIKSIRLIGHRMIMNAAFLVERERERKLRDRVLALDERYGDRLELRYVSGLPPYNFVDMRISLEDGDAGAYAETGEGG